MYSPISLTAFGGGLTDLQLLHLVKASDLMHFDIYIQLGNCHDADTSISPRSFSFLSPTLSPPATTVVQFAYSRILYIWNHMVHTLY